MYTDKLFPIFFHSRLSKFKMAATSKKCNFSPYGCNKCTFAVHNMSIWAILIVVMHHSTELTILQWLFKFTSEFILVVCSWVCKNTAYKHPKFATAKKTLFFYL